MRTLIFPLIATIVLISLSSFSLKYASNDLSKTEQFISVKSEIKSSTIFEKASEHPVKPQKNKTKKLKKLNKKNDEPKNEGLGIAGFILGIVGWFTPYLGFIMCLLALIFGAVSLGKIVRNPDKFKGKGFAITALIMGILGILINILLVSIIVSIFFI
jgi:uncharacterized membrane protein